ncbi:MAG: transglutaminase-like cysteine peptidase [Rhizobiaceae bacterium]|nr:transglutaminase-like cysteine peptidase [Rhizobiaceae bacterium]
MIKQIAKIGGAAFLFSLASAQATNAVGNGSHMITTGRTSQPIGHYEYCKQYRSDCRIKTKVTQAPKLTRKRWNDLVEVNSFSNNTIKPVTDLEAYNREEVWVYPTSYGDCEDYVLMKRHMLMQRGWPASSLLITVVRQPNGEGHAVLTVRTDKADYVLDNLDGKIRQWNHTRYTFLKRQATHHSGHWQDIKDFRG